MNPSGRDAETGETYRGGQGTHAEVPHGPHTWDLRRWGRSHPTPPSDEAREPAPLPEERGQAPEPRAPGSRAPHANPGAAAAPEHARPRRRSQGPQSDRSPSPGRGRPEGQHRPRRGKESRAGWSRTPWRKRVGRAEERAGAGAERPSRPRPGGQALTRRRWLRKSSYPRSAATRPGQHRSGRTRCSAARAAQQLASGPAHPALVGPPPATAPIGRSGRGHAHGSGRLAGSGGT
ncbi:translation initiation factor IF-2-like [Felis catus]|uniref:translation initiation factor IF-2-like n=1 Tax=Felis catus TaxID=9685 RepID=UPI001D19DDC4|nr:translation initiation factor IF-2-like [Felis catus]